MSKILELRRERHAISLEMATALDHPNKAEGLARFKKLDAEAERLWQQIDQLETAEQTAIERRSFALPSVGATGRYDASPFEHAEALGEERVTNSEEYADAFRRHLKKGTPIEMQLSQAEQRDYAGLSDAADGVLVPAGFQRELNITLLATGQMRKFCRVITTATGNTLPWPGMDDTANSGSWLAEAAAVNQTNPTYSGVTFGANLLSSDAVLISVQLLQDSAFPMESELAQAFGVRLGRGTNLAYTLGNGSGQPKGLIPALTAATGRSVTALGAYANSGNSGDTDLNSLGTDDFANLIAKVDVSYRDGYECSFLANQATWDAQRLRKDKYGRPVWQVSLAQGEPDKVYGFSYGYNNSQPVQAPGAVGVVVFGAFQKYIIRDVLGMTVVRYNELYMPNHQIGFEAFLRTDGQLLQPKAFSMLNIAAS
jgi:HK97 family phage major capsid protein